MLSEISTFSRFLYLNAYAFLLAFGGIGIALMPCYRIGWWLVALQVVLFWICEKNALRIFRSWSDKKRKYAVLMQKNSAEFRPDTFTEYVQAPCGQLLVKIVLADLNKPYEYRNLLKLKQPLWKMLKTGCKSQKTVIYINNKKL
ncbi:MAG: hypothetical protein LBS50_01905 [Prevotellaceae bacterium]|jgi:hypothetical protein|nr:hypothetical protein [Prevotellaceae bacterium]